MGVLGVVFVHPEEKIFQQNGEIVAVTVTKQYPPDPTSMSFGKSIFRGGGFRAPRAS